MLGAIIEVQHLATKLHGGGALARFTIKA